MNAGLAEIMLYALMLLLPISALAARRLPLGATVRLALIWVAIFAIVVGAVLLFQRGSTDGAARTSQRITANFT